MLRLPNFIFIGPSKTGSTWIFELLRSHPKVFVPISKDIYFFDKFFEKGLDWYLKHFKNAKPDQLVGELSHDYFSSKIAIDRISDVFNRKVKLICCLRDPFERALSSYRYFVRNGIASGGFAEEANKHPEIIIEGYYGEHLNYIFEKFPRKNILVLLYDDLCSDPKEFAKQIFDFLGIKPIEDSPLYSKKVNSAAAPRVRLIAKAAKSMAVLLRKAGYPNLVGALKRNELILRALFKEAKSKSHEKSMEIFPSHVISRYNLEIEVLQGLLGANLQHWKLQKVGHEAEDICNH